MNRPPSLPIDKVIPEIIGGLQARGQVVLRAPTGAGKTTRVPPAILESGLAGTEQILMLEPRRLAARTAARRMSLERETPLGGEVGYQVRFDEQCSRETRILVVTEGVLLRRLQDDPFLEGVAAVLFDEFHERNLASDLVLGMVTRIRQTVRPELKVVVMSATLDPQPIAEYLGDAAVVESKGRTFKVKIEHDAPFARMELPKLVEWGVQRALLDGKGDVLVFLPGVGEIRRTARQLEPLVQREGLELFQLYGDLPAEEQDRVLQPRERRKLILSTNVAETSVTIEGIGTVVDTGLAKVLRFDPQIGLDRLQLEPISKSSEDQRAGRAGRTRDGYCLRLWNLGWGGHGRERDEPEIRRIDLAGAVLQLKNWGEHAVLDFPWFDAPRPEAVEQAEELLKRLDALDENGNVTQLGRLMVRLPLHPRLARLLIEGQRLGQLRRVAWLAALLSERDPFVRHQYIAETKRLPTVAVHHSQSDLLDRLDALEEAEQRGTTDFACGKLNQGAARFIARVRDQLIRSLKGAVLDDLEPRETDSIPPDEALLRALVVAYPDRVARRRDGRSDKGVMVGGRGVRLAATSSVRDGPFFLCVDVDAGQTEALVRQASIVEPEWLPASSRRTQVDLFFHPSQKQVVARRRELYEDLVLSESPAPLPDDERPAELLFTEALRAWEQIFPRQDARVAEFVQRVNSLAEWMPELGLPTLDEEALHQVLRGLCGHRGRFAQGTRRSHHAARQFQMPCAEQSAPGGCRSFAELKKADWAGELRSLLTWDQLQALDREAPEHLQVPSGSRIRLTYEAGRPPVLAVRIQEVFGLRETPRIAGGRVPVLLHLLGPNMRPQQITDDLESFWNNTYPVVRKELARRYPKHPWPADPSAAKPIRK
jgi:ATP-dependent helicase HrpB